MMRLSIVFIFAAMVSWFVWDLSTGNEKQISVRTAEIRKVAPVNLGRIEAKTAEISRSIINIFTYRDAVTTRPVEKTTAPVSTVTTPPVSSIPETKSPALSSPGFNPTILGYSMEDGSYRVFMLVSQDIHVVYKGYVLDNTWEVTEIDGQQVLLTNMRTGSVQRVELPE